MIDHLDLVDALIDLRSEALRRAGRHPTDAHGRSDCLHLASRTAMLLDRVAPGWDSDEPEPDNPFDECKIEDRKR